MHSPVPHLLSWARRRRLLVMAGALPVLVLSALGIARLSFDTDVLSLLPRDGTAIPAFRSFVQQFGSLDELYVVFTAPEGHAIEDYRDEIEAWTARLRTVPEISRVDAGLMDDARALSWLGDRQLLLLEGQALERALARLRGEEMRAAIVARRELLSLPSPAVMELVRQDPLALYDLLRDQIGGAHGGVIPAASEQGYVSRDSRRRLLVARPVRPPFDTAFSRLLMTQMENVRREMAAARPASGDEDGRAAMSVEFAGGHRIAVETEAVVRRESIMNTVLSLALILPLLFIVFRSLWLLGVGPLPSGIALAVVLGLLGIAGATLSAAATASAAMLFGLGVDGVVLLYVSYTLALRDGLAPDAAIDSLSGPASSMLLGMWTTAATFYGLTIVDFPSLQQLGSLIGHSMVLCGLLTLLLVPALLPRRPRARPARALVLPHLASWVERHRGRILAVALLVTLGLAIAATRIQVDPTLDRLRSVTPAAALMTRIGTEFGLPQDVYVVLRHGRDLDALLGADETMAAAVAATLPDVPVQRASALLPSQEAQHRRGKAVTRAGIAHRRVLSHLETTAAAEGFRPRTFSPFEERLPRMLDVDQRLTYDGYLQHGLGDLIGRFISRQGNDWTVASYAFPSSSEQVAALKQVVQDSGGQAILTGVPLVNRELAEGFVPQFTKGLLAGTLVVLVLILAAFRDWRLASLSLLPALVGLVWAAGLLALAGIELDLFAVFAVVTFVGIGVDYGVHVVHRYRDKGDARQAIDDLAPVILVAAAITLAGYGTLIGSTYPPLRSIGLVSIVTVVTLAAASLLVLPALLSFASATLSREPHRV